MEVVYAGNKMRTNGITARSSGASIVEPNRVVTVRAVLKTKVIFYELAGVFNLKDFEPVKDGNAKKAT